VARVRTPIRAWNSHFDGTARPTSRRNITAFRARLCAGTREASMRSARARCRTSFSRADAFRPRIAGAPAVNSSDRTIAAAWERFRIGYRGLAGIDTKRSHRASSPSRRPKSSRPNRTARVPSIARTRRANSDGVSAIRRNFFSFRVAIPVVPATRSAPRSAPSRSGTVLAPARMSAPCIARFTASSPIAHGSTRTSRRNPKFAIARATAPTFPSFFGWTRTTATSSIRARPRGGLLYNTSNTQGVPRVALKIAYDGTAFHGQARQPGLPTVEGEVIRALTRARAIRDPRASRFQSASRTDRGVSALGNVVAFDTALAPAAAARAFNAKAREVWAWAAAAVPEGFSARRARGRWYRYALPPGHDPEPLDAALRGFVGEHDFRNFTRDRTRTVARIDAASASRDGVRVVLDFRAPSFRWNLVRRLVAAALLVEAGRAGPEDLQRALRESPRVDFGLAPPEPLTLMDIEYDVAFEPVRDPTTAARVARLLQERTRALAFVEALRDRLAEGRPLP